jgi:hypothetical protein
MVVPPAHFDNGMSLGIFGFDSLFTSKTNSSLTNLTFFIISALCGFGVLVSLS